MMKKYVFCLFILSCSILTAESQNKKHQTVKEVVNKMLEIISVEIGDEPNWEEYRDLFLPNAQKIIVNPKAKNPANKVRSFSVEEFIRYIGPLYSRDGFKEKTIGLTINEFNGTANVFQSYHANNLKGTYEKKGINNYQLVWVNNRWWIASTTWSAEDKDNPIPKKYLSNN